MAQEFYPPVGFYFSLTFSGIRNKFDNAFQEASGLTASIKISEIEEGGLNEYKHKVPFHTEYENLVLKRGYIAYDSDISEWCDKTFSNAPLVTRDITLNLLDNEGIILSSWNFKNAWPVKWSIGNFNAQESTVLIETIEFAYSYYTRESANMYNGVSSLFR